MNGHIKYYWFNQDLKFLRIKKGKRNVYKALATIFDRIKGCDSEIEVWGSV